MLTIRSITLAVVALAALATGAGAQKKKRAVRPVELRGSEASVERMYDFARTHGLPFYRDASDVFEAVSQGRLVELFGDATFELKSDVGFSYATPEAKQFVAAFAPQYLSACNAHLVVTSAERPINRQPKNAAPHSVHPTGIAVDFRRPQAGPCLNWMRGALAELERAGIIEATEERHPVHLHVAVLIAPGATVVLPQLVRTTVAMRSPRSATADRGQR